MRDNIGSFIKEQRIKNKISQNKLAEILFIDRTLISKWENDKATPCMNEIVKMAELFHISIEEFISGELYNKDNKEELKANLNNYLIEQENKLNKTKKNLLSTMLFAITILLLFFIYYFINTYNKVTVYRVVGISDNYYLKTGVLLFTQNKSYFKIGYFNSNITEIEIYIQDDNRITIYKGEPDIVKMDDTDYNTSLNNNNFIKYKDKIFMDVYTKDGKETMKLEFKNEFQNDELAYDSTDKTINKDYVPFYSISNYIKDNFKKEDEYYIYKENNMNITYDMKNNRIYIHHQSKRIEYQIKDNHFMYYNGEDKYTIINSKIKETNISEKETFKLYNYYMNYINKYLDR